MLPIAKHRAINAFAGLREATVRSVDGRPVPLQVDGDHMSDETVAELTVGPGALHVVS